MRGRVVHLVEYSHWHRGSASAETRANLERLPALVVASYASPFADRGKLVDAEPRSVDRVALNLTRPTLGIAATSLLTLGFASAALARRKNDTLELISRSWF